MEVVVVVGTRPEAIKMAPIIFELRRRSQFVVRVVATGQHQPELLGLQAVFGILPDEDLAVFEPGQSLASLGARVLERMSRYLERTTTDAVLVQGDTNSTVAASLAAFYARIPVVHVEAGLRTGDPTNPFPEEMNRRLVSQMASLHLAPTKTAREHLISEKVAAEKIVVTGNTVIDAFLQAASQSNVMWDPSLGAFLGERRLILVTMHRRESWGAGMTSIARALRTLGAANPEWVILIPLHPNPVVQQAVRPIVASSPNIRIVEPQDYLTFAQLIQRASLVITDSGGVQEEAPSIGCPVLVTRDTTERPEAVDAGTVRLVGAVESRIVAEAQRLISDRRAYRDMAGATNPYGDGRAAHRTADALAHFFGLGPAAEEFTPAPQSESRIQA